MFRRTWNGVCPDTRYLHASDRIFLRKKWIMAKHSKRAKHWEGMQHWAWEDKSLKLVLQWIIYQLNRNLATQDLLINLLTIHWAARLCRALPWVPLFNPHHCLVGGTNGKNKNKKPACQCRGRKRCRFDPWVGKTPWRRPLQLTAVFFAWRIPQAESHKVRHDWSNLACTHCLVDRNDSPNCLAEDT